MKNKDNEFIFRQKGVCPICNSDVLFFSENTWLRDHFKCLNCGSIPRQRAIMLIIEKYYPNWKKLDIHESSPGDCSISNKLKNECKGYIGSQYYPQKEFGKIINGYRNENLENQTFEDNVFDIIITQDVFEHIYNPAKAFFEICRTLKNGGAHIFSVPIINKFKDSEIWATMDNKGNPIFHKTEEWHGNPVDLKGAPVTMHWGYDIINYIKQHSGLKTIIEYIYDLNFGIWAEYIEILISKKV